MPAHQYSSIFEPGCEHCGSIVDIQRWQFVSPKAPSNKVQIRLALELKVLTVTNVNFRNRFWGAPGPWSLPLLTLDLNTWGQLCTFDSHQLGLIVDIQSQQFRPIYDINEWTLIPTIEVFILDVHNQGQLLTLDVRHSAHWLTFRSSDVNDWPPSRESIVQNLPYLVTLNVQNGRSLWTSDCQHFRLIVYHQLPKFHSVLDIKSQQFRPIVEMW